MSTEVFEDIGTIQSDDSMVQKAEKKILTWLVFTAGEETYAIDSSEVREIVRNNEIYPIPFVPPYVKGVLNCYGDPFAVVDVSLFLGQEIQNSQLFMILNNENKLSLQISDIQEFHNASDVESQKLSESTDASYFTGAISFDGVTAPVLSVEGIVDKIRGDLEGK